MATQSGIPDIAPRLQVEEQHPRVGGLVYSLLTRAHSKSDAPAGDAFPSSERRMLRGGSPSRQGFATPPTRIGDLSGTRDLDVIRAYVFMSPAVAGPEAAQVVLHSGRAPGRRRFTNLINFRWQGSGESVPGFVDRNRVQGAPQGVEKEICFLGAQAERRANLERVTETPCRANQYLTVPQPVDDSAGQLRIGRVVPC